MAKGKKNSPNKISKYKIHFGIAEANKKRRIEKQKRKEEKKRQKLALRNKNKGIEK